jgi:hypothetical protein
VNNLENGLGEYALWGGKARIFQDDGDGNNIFLGEDVTALIPVGEKTELYVGDSRDIVVTQQKMKEQQIPRQRNNQGRVVLYDMDEEITAKIENFKDSPSVLTMIQHIEGQWEMEQCTLDGSNAQYKRKDAYTLEFEIQLPARSESGPATKELKMHYIRKNIRPGRVRR